MKKINNAGFSPESLRLIGPALALQQVTATAAKIVPLPSTGRLVVIGTPADVARLMEIAPVASACGAWPDDGSICATECRHRAENPQASTADWAECERIANIGSAGQSAAGIFGRPDRR